MSQHAHTNSLLYVEGLKRKFGGVMAVSDLDMSVSTNEIVGLIGPNGAGKSTTFNLISGHLQPTEGRIVFDGKTVTGKSLARMSRLGLARTFQHESLLKDLSVYDNILVGALRFTNRKEREGRIFETAMRVGLSEHLLERAGSLPHGLQRMLSIAIAIAARPKLLCLDEPLTGLNATEVKNALGIIRSLQAEMKCSILFVEHNMRAVMELCDRVIVLASGRILAEGTPAEIGSNASVIEAYLGVPS